jgi:hypothetical protein
MWAKRSASVDQKRRLAERVAYFHLIPQFLPGSYMMRRLGWLVVAGLLAPVVFAGWVSFSPDSFLTPPTGDWSGRWYMSRSRPTAGGSLRSAEAW